jgi:hypothetical protein
MASKWEKRAQISRNKKELSSLSTSNLFMNLSARAPIDLEILIQISNSGHHSMAAMETRNASLASRLLTSGEREKLSASTEKNLKGRS